MHRFDQWTLDAIRSEEGAMSWFEEQRFEWIPTSASALEQMMEGKSVVLVTDHERQWFAHYITLSLNKRNDRPLIPIVSLDALYPHYDQLAGTEGLNDTLGDMLDITFKGDYFFWYIGKGDDRRADIAKRSSNSLLWIMDERFQNALALRSYDSLIDIKLLQLYRLFDKTLSAVLFGEIHVRE